MAKISIIIPYQNVEQYLNQCLESIKNQTFSDLEVICINDGSEDNSQQIVQNFINEDSRFKNINLSQKSGQSFARNEGLRIAQGEYIAFIDADDWADNTMMEKLYNKAQETDSDITMCQAFLYNQVTCVTYTNDYYSLIPLKDVINKTFNYNDVTDEILDINVVIWNKLFKAKFLKEINAVFENGYIFEDLPFFFNTFLKAKKVSAVKEPLYYYRQNQTNSTMSRCDEKVCDRIKMVELSYNILREQPFFSAKKIDILNWVFDDIFHRFLHLDSRFHEKYYNLMQEFFKKIQYSEQEKQNLLEGYYAQEFFYICEHDFYQFNNYLTQTFEKYKKAASNKELNLVEWWQNYYKKELKVQKDWYEENLKEQLTSQKNWYEDKLVEQKCELENAFENNLKEQLSSQTKFYEDKMQQQKKDIENWHNNNLKEKLSSQAQWYEGEIERRKKEVEDWHINNLQEKINELNQKHEEEIKPIKFLIKIIRKLKKIKQQHNEKKISSENSIPKVSVILPIYNVDKYLRQSLDSLINQTLKEIEIICINDGSTDNCHDILEEYKLKDNRIKVIHTKNQGTGAARNEGLKIATGEFIGFVDPDDWAKPNMFERLYSIAKSKDSDIVMSVPDGYNEKKQCYETFDYFCDYNFKDIPKNKNFNWKDLSPFKYPMCVWNKIYKKELFDKHNINFIEGLDFEDHKAIFGSLLTAEKIYFTPEKLYVYRFNREGSILSDKNQRLIDHIEIFDIVEKIMHDTNTFDKLKLDFLEYKIHNILLYYGKIKEEFKNKYYEKMVASLKNIQLNEQEEKHLLEKFPELKEILNK